MFPGTSHEVARRAVAAVDELDAECRHNSDAYQNSALLRALAVAPGTTLSPPADFALKEPLTVFHTTNPPHITLCDLVDSILARLPRGAIPDGSDRAAVALYTVATCRRYERLTGIKVSHAMAHRLVATAMLVSAKLIVDCRITNRLFARASGVALGELNHLESWLLVAIDFSVPLPPSHPLAGGDAAADWAFMRAPSAQVKASSPALPRLPVAPVFLPLKAPPSSPATLITVAA